MATVLTVNQHSSHSRLGCWVVDLSHTSILPGIFNGISKDYVGAFDLHTTIDHIGHIHLRDDLSIENSLTVSIPEIIIDQVRSHRMLRVGHLIPSKLSAILISPLSIVPVVRLFSVLESSVIIQGRGDSVV